MYHHLNDRSFHDLLKNNLLCECELLKLSMTGLLNNLCGNLKKYLMPRIVIKMLLRIIVINFKVINICPHLKKKKKQKYLFFLKYLQLLLKKYYTCMCVCFFLPLKFQGKL